MHVKLCKYFLPPILLAAHLICMLPIIQPRRFIFCVLLQVEQNASEVKTTDLFRLTLWRTAFIACSSLKNSSLLSLKDQNTVLKKPWNRALYITCALLISFGGKKILNWMPFFCKYSKVYKVLFFKGKNNGSSSDQNVKTALILYSTHISYCRN